MLEPSLTMRRLRMQGMKHNDTAVSRLEKYFGKKIKHIKNNLITFEDNETAKLERGESIDMQKLSTGQSQQ